jgi:hypothetical protein
MLQYLLILLTVGCVPVLEGLDSTSKNLVVQESLGFGPGSVFTTIFAIWFVVSGLVLVFHGEESISIVYFLSGAYSFGIGTVILFNILQSNQIVVLGDSAELIVFGITIGIAILGGLVGYAVKEISLFLLGTMAGTILSCLIFQLQIINQIVSNIALRGSIIGATSLALGLGCLSTPTRMVMVCISSSLVGSAAFFIAIDNWIQSEFQKFIFKTIIGLQINGYDARSYGVLAGFLALSILGIYLQYTHRIKR